MNELMLNPEFNLYERKGQAFCSSRQVAEEFGRQHKHILDTISDLAEPTSGLSKELGLSKSGDTSCKDSKCITRFDSSYTALQRLVN